ncbi:hypothetical protein ACJMK2_014773 [Sinanodonta woodiana]|uniref:Uncharacterized protein n=1 Tax=Sinanodonta woodiana TaxID=1069815 RepID=A0ABD3V2X1_SINWO
MATARERLIFCNGDVIARTILLESADETPDYSSIVICQDKIIVLDNKDNKVKIHGLFDGKLLDKLDSDSIQSAICLMDATTICVLHLDGLIKIVSIKSEDMSAVFTETKRFCQVNVFDYCHSVVKAHDNIIVVGVKEDTTYWCIASVDNGHVDTIHRICKWSFWSYVTTKDNIIYISCFVDVDDDDNGVYGYDILNPSECKYKYKHNNLQCPTSIAIIKDGTILVGDYLDSCIHQLTASCELVSYPWYLLAMVSKESLWTPHAMFCNNGRLYTTCWGSTEITEFHHWYQAQFLMSHEKEQPISVETSKEIEQGNDDTGQSNVKTAVPPSGQRPMDSDSGKQDQNAEESRIKRIFLRISLLHNIRFFFSKSIIISDIKQYGYNKIIQCRLRRMSNHLCKQIRGAIRVWTGYRTEDMHTPIFVVMFKKNIIPGEIILSKPYDDYEIVFRNEHTPSDEEEQISERSEKHTNTISKEDMSRVLDCIANNTERLMNEHSSLSIIAPSTVKAVGFNARSNESKLVDSMCIVLYIPIKGIIPMGEKEFPKDIDGISTDVREGEFVFHCQVGPDEFHSKLPMGCCISTKDDLNGTLGGFVDLSSSAIGCITAAHAVLNVNQLKMAMKNALSDEDIRDIQIYQPNVDTEAFGKVVQIAFVQGNQHEPTVDAALIEITDHERTPYTGMFPFINYPFLGFTTENPMMYNSGNIRYNSDISKEFKVVKYGQATSNTWGKLAWDGASVRLVDTRYQLRATPDDDNVSHLIYYQQMIVKSSDAINFSMPGDSGALVFVNNEANGELEAIGLLVGGDTQTGKAQKHFVTPIKAVFTKLELGTHMFRHFPNINEGE